jgi:small subunit ribosomal protein S8
MSLSDPIADMLTRIRNALRINSEQVSVKASKICEGIAAVLKQGLLRINLKYDPDGRPVISEITRISKPGKRVYSPVERLPRVLGGMGVAIVSTSKGVMSDRSCRKDNVGGEILCTVS